VWNAVTHEIAASAVGAEILEPQEAAETWRDEPEVEVDQIAVVD
jgi:hypothetical protein